MILLYRPRLEALPIFRLRHDRLVLLMATTILFTKFVSTTASGPRRHRRPPRGLSIEKGRGRRRRGRAVVLPRAQRGLQKEARLNSCLFFIPKVCKENSFSSRLKGSGRRRPKSGTRRRRKRKGRARRQRRRTSFPYHHYYPPYLAHF